MINVRGAYIEITSECNLRCKHCYQSHSVESIPFDRLTQTVDRLIKSGADRFYISGSEPLLYEKFDELVDYLKSLDMKWVLVTNGTLIDKKITQRLMSAKNLLRVIISLDGASEYTHEINRGKGTYVRTIDSINRLKSSCVPVSIQMVVAKYNQSEINDFKKLAESLSIDYSYIMVGNLEALPDSCHRLKIDDRELYHVIKKAGVESKIPFSCPIGQEEKYKMMLYIDYCGMVYLCKGMRRAGIEVGNIYGCFFDENKYAELLRKKEEFIMDKNDCKNCFLEKECNKGCFAKALIREDSLDGQCNLRLQYKMDSILEKLC